MNADGTGQTNLTNNVAVDSWPAWSPDGTKIAFTSQRDGNGEIYSMNADGTHPGSPHEQRGRGRTARLVARWQQDRVHDIPRRQR